VALASQREKALKQHDNRGLEAGLDPEALSASPFLHREPWNASLVSSLTQRQPLGDPRPTARAAGKRAPDTLASRRSSTSESNPFGKQPTSYIGSEPTQTNRNAAMQTEEQKIVQAMSTAQKLRAAERLY